MSQTWNRHRSYGACFFGFLFFCGALFNRGGYALPFYLDFFALFHLINRTGHA